MFKILDPQCKPSKGSKYSAAIDLRSKEEMIIVPGDTILIPLGVKIDNKEMPIYLQNNLHRHYMQLMLRSSLSEELIIANGVGVIDLDYPGELMLRVHNPIKKAELNETTNSISAYCKGIDVEIKKGQRVAQVMILEHKSYLFGIETKSKRTGGFGSTGKQ